MERFAEQDRLEQMNAQKRRLKVAQHAREVERLIQEKREMYEAAMVSIHCLQSTCFPMLRCFHCCTAGMFCCWACLATGMQMAGFTSLSVLGTVYKKLVKHGTNYVTLTAVACPQAAQQHFALTAVKSQRNHTATSMIYVWRELTCIAEQVSSLVPAG